MPDSFEELCHSIKVYKNKADAPFFCVMSHDGKVFTAGKEAFFDSIFDDTILCLWDFVGKRVPPQRFIEAILESIKKFIENEGIRFRQIQINEYMELFSMFLANKEKG